MLPSASDPEPVSSDMVNAPFRTSPPPQSPSPQLRSSASSSWSMRARSSPVPPPAVPPPGVAGGLKEFPLGAGLAHVPVALLVDQELSTLHDPKHAAGPIHCLIGCDRSPSMALRNHRPDAERCAAVLAAEGAPLAPRAPLTSACPSSPGCFRWRVPRQPPRLFSYALLRVGIRVAALALW